MRPGGASAPSVCAAAAGSAAATGDIVQSALFKAGITVVNRRDPRVITTEVQWNIRDPRRIVPTDYYITGSINSLDFIPGGGFEVRVAGVGPRYRQNRLLVGLDLAMTDADTGQIVANVPLQKQIVATESGIGAGRFFGETLLSLDVGGKQREALHFALRHMLNLATFELLTQVMTAQNYADCRAAIDSAHGRLESTGTAAAVAAYEQGTAPQPAVVRREAPAASTVPAAAPPAAAAAPAGGGQPPNALTTPPDESSGTDGFYWQDEAPNGPSNEEVTTILPD